MRDLNLEYYTHLTDQVYAERDRIGQAIFDGFADLADPWFGTHHDEVLERFNAFSLSDLHLDLKSTDGGYGTWPRDVGGSHADLVGFHEALLYFLAGWRAARNVHRLDDTRVVHVDKDGLAYDVYIGNQFRRFGYDLPQSKWANPFKIGRDGDRATVIARYRDEHLAAHPELLASREELRGKRLGCWCPPLPCHGDVLVDLLDGPKEDKA